MIRFQWNSSAIIFFVSLLFGNSCGYKEMPKKKLPTGIYLLEEKSSLYTLEYSAMYVLPGKYYLDTTALLDEEDFESIGELGNEDTLTINLNTKGDALFEGKEYSMNGKKIALILDGMLAGELKFNFEKHADDYYGHSFILLANRMQIISLSDSLNKKWKTRIIPDDKKVKDGVVKEYYRSGKIYSETQYKNGIQVVDKTYYENGIVCSEHSYPDTLALIGQSWCREYFPNGKIRTDSQNFYFYSENSGPSRSKSYNVNGILVSEINAEWNKKFNYYATRDYDEDGNLEFQDSTFNLPPFPGQRKNENPSVTYSEHYKDGKLFYKEHEYDRGKLNWIPCDFTYEYDFYRLKYIYQKNIPTWQQLYKHDCDSARIVNRH